MKRNYFAFLLLLAPILWVGAQDLVFEDGFETPPPEDSKVASIIITPETVLVTEVGVEHQLTAMAYNASGDVVEAEIAWASSDELVVIVDENGVITSQVSAGSATVTATADGVDSQPTVVIAAMPVSNSVLVSDAQFIGDPELVDPNGGFDVGTRYIVRLMDIAPPDIGDTLLASEDMEVGGRVVDVVEENDGTVTVTLEAVPIDELFDELVIDETIALTDDDISIPQEIQDAFDITRLEDGSYQFTLKEGAAAVSATNQAPYAVLPSGVVVQQGPFECQVPVSLPITIGAVQTNLNPFFNVIFQYDTNNGGFQKLAVQGGLTVENKVELGLSASISAKISCAAGFFTITIPIGGPLALVLGGQVPLDAGFSVGGSISWLDFQAEFTGKAEASVELGVACPGGTNCSFLNELETDVESDVDWPQSLDDTLQFDIDPSLGIFAKETLEIGPRWVRSLRIKIIEASAGPTVDLEIETVYDQVADSKQAGFDLSVEGSIAPKVGNGLLGISWPTPQVKLLDVPIAESPRSTSFSIDNSSPQINDTVNFQLDLDDVNFPVIGIYIVDEVSLWLVEDSANPVPVRIADQQASDQQLSFTIPWTVTATEGDVYAFVGTTIIPSAIFGTYSNIKVDRLSLTEPQPPELWYGHDTVGFNDLRLFGFCNNSATASGSCRVCWSGLPNGTIDTSTMNAAPPIGCFDNATELFVFEITPDSCEDGNVAADLYTVTLGADQPPEITSPVRVECEISVPDTCGYPEVSCTELDPNVFFFD
jgi:hypothetical protein